MTIDARPSTPSMTSDGLEPIPQPKGLPVVGNLLDILGDTPVQSLMQLARQQEDIFALKLPGRTMVVVFGPRLVDEVCDDKRFDKLVQLRSRGNTSIAGDGLFTAWTYEPNWAKAHNILLPNFSQTSMKSYMPMMLDVASQLTEKWQRLNPDELVNVTDDMTRLALDTIGLCGFGYRFNSFYREGPHPFVASMTRALGESRARQTRLPGQNALMVRHRRQFQDDTTTMYSLVDQLIRERKADQELDTQDSAATTDLLGYMLSGVDKKTGDRLDDVNIRYQIITFLVAGHETTSGLLSFALYMLMHNPLVLARAYAEVDTVLGGDLGVDPTYEQVRKLEYVTQILKETLRLWPTAPGLSRYPYEKTVIGGKYELEKGQEIFVLTPMLHRDLTTWGPSPEAFNPDRFTREEEHHRPANVYKPFGDGQRACIGRQFAMQEATLVLGMLLQRFELVDRTSYQLKIRETLTIKPENFLIGVRPRTQRTNLLPIPAPIIREIEPEPAPVAVLVNHATPLLVLFGSNLGTTEDLARRVAADGAARGFSTSLATLDDYAGKLPTDGAVLVTSASYNGAPPDNAARFFNWLTAPTLGPDALRGVKYTVFGCGSREWPSTYQLVPDTIDAALAAHGAERVYARGEGDTSDDFDGQLRSWYAALWPALASAVGVPVDADADNAPAVPRYEVQIAVEEATPSPFGPDYAAKSVTVLTNRELQTGSAGVPPQRSTRHIEVALPADVAYLPGDYLGVLPRNSDELVQRVATRFGIEPRSRIRITNNSTSASFLPVDRPIELGDLLAGYVDLQDVATRSQLQLLAEYTECPPDKAKLLAVAGDDPESVVRYRSEILDRHISIIDVLDDYASCTLPLNIYLECIPPLKPRYYSISSSPLVDRGRCSVTVGLLDAPARSGRGQYHGVCSWYLAHQADGSRLDAFVKAPSTPFRLPADASTPIIMVGAGTGLAPYRAFLQQRSELKKQGSVLGPSLLFFGCRDPQVDYLYEDELRGFEAAGITRVACAFSRLPGTPKTYVQDTIKARADDVWDLLERGAVVYVCGDASRMAPDVRKSFADVYRAKTASDSAGADTWLSNLVAAHRYLADVWPTG